VISRCDYCRRSQEFREHDGQCASCGAPLPKPKPRVIEREYRVTREAFDATRFGDETEQYVLGVADYKIKERVEEP